MGRVSQGEAGLSRGTENVPGTFKRLVKCWWWHYGDPGVRSRLLRKSSGQLYQMLLKGPER